MTVLNFDSKQCERVRRQLDAYLSNELLVETTSEVLRHLETCEACSEELEARMRLRKALRKAAQERVPPEHLKEAIGRRLRRGQPGFFGEFRVTPWAVALACLVLAAFAAQQGFRFQRGKQLVSKVLSIGVTDHVLCTLKGHNYPEIASPPDQLRKKLGPEYAGLLPIVQQKLPEFQVLEAHICQLPGSSRNYVHFVTRGRGTLLSVILTRRDGASLPQGRFLVAKDAGGVDLYQARLEGMNVAGFESNQYFGFVVSDLGMGEIIQIAAGIAPDLRKALDKGPGTENAALQNSPFNFVTGRVDSGFPARRTRRQAKRRCLLPRDGWRINPIGGFGSVIKRTIFQRSVQGMDGECSAALEGGTCRAQEAAEKRVAAGLPRHPTVDPIEVMAT